MIFVAIAAYADSELPRTLRSCLAHAQRPEDLRFGICWQGDPEAPISLDEFRDDPRFRFLDYTTRESRGGSWARNLAQGLWQNEEFTLQIDSHTYFEEEWDVRLIALLAGLPAAKPLLTGILPLFFYDDDGVPQRDAEEGVPSMAVGDWKKELGWAPWNIRAAPCPRFPARTRLLSGMFVFSLGRWNAEVRQDPDHYYWGEEFALAVRSYTWGYDMFLPSEALLRHMDHRRERPRRHWEHGQDVIDARNAIAFERLRKLVYSDRHEELQPYGLGPVRSLREYELFSGFDLKRKVAHPDVFTGVSPDPITIRREEDWDACVSFRSFHLASLPWKRRWYERLRGSGPVRLGSWARRRLTRRSWMPWSPQGTGRLRQRPFRGPVASGARPWPALRPPDASG